MKNIMIIGAGQLGSRHLQALINIEDALNITVVDPSPDSLQTAKERYQSAGPPARHRVTYISSLQTISSIVSIDIAIIATSSDVRASVTRALLDRIKVKTIVFEKILFTLRDDYQLIPNLLEEKHTKGFVNCSMRMMSFYANIRRYFFGTKFKYIVSGSQYGLVTNLVHYIDHMAYLTGDLSYKANAEFLDPTLIDSKRRGFHELDGTFRVTFTNGSQGLFTCESENESPLILQVFNNRCHVISRESEGKVWLSNLENNWKWEERDFKIPFQSQLTTELVRSILSTGDCALPSLSESIKVHLPYLEAIKQFTDKNFDIDSDKYPFT